MYIFIIYIYIIYIYICSKYINSYVSSDKNKILLKILYIYIYIYIYIYAFLESLVSCLHLAVSSGLLFDSYF